ARRRGDALLHARGEAGARRMERRGAEGAAHAEGQARRGVVAARGAQPGAQGDGKVERPQDAASRDAAAPHRHRPHADAVDRRGARAARARHGANAARSVPGDRLMRRALLLWMVAFPVYADIEPGNWEITSRT